MRLSLIIYFMLLGVFDYFRMLDQPVIGFLVFILPISIAITYSLFIKPLLAGQSPRFLSVFNRYSRAHYIHTIIFASYLIIVLVGFFRSIYAGTREGIIGLAEVAIVLAIVIYFYAIVTDAIRSGYYQLLPRYIGISLFILCLANVLGAAVGIENPGAETIYNRDIENSLGIIDYRISFPFTTSERMLSIQAGILVLFGLFRWRENFRKYDKLMSICMVAIGTAVLIGAGGRIPVLMLIATVAFIILWKVSHQFSVSLLLIFLIFPFLLVFVDIVGLAYTAADNIGIQLSQPTENIRTFSNRDVIYAVILQWYMSSGDLVSQLFGYGAHGQITSGLSSDYAMLFGHSYANPDRMTAHNTLLQSLVDYGIIGAGVYVALIVSIVLSIRRNRLIHKKHGSTYKHEKPLIAILIYTVGCSMTESSITYYALGVWSVFIAINLFVMLDGTNLNRMKQIGTAETS